MMINRQDTPAPFMRHAEPGASSRTVMTAATTSFLPDALPQTPQNKLRIKRASRLHWGRDTHMDSDARASADETLRPERISHDLSLTDNPRHSVVDNMLMSLNPDQPKLFFPPKDQSSCSSESGASAPPKTAHSRRLHSSSTNSDYIFPLDNSPDYRSYGLGRGRRSNSSSNFPSALDRIDAVRTLWDEADSKGSHNPASPRAVTANTRARGHTKKSSRSSGSSSMDYGQTRSRAMMRPPNALGRRSASFDHGYARRGLHSASSSGVHPALGSSLSRPIVYNDIEAAPMPTVPAGPRRGDQSPVFPPHPMHSAPFAPALQRRNSGKSSKNLHMRKGKVDPTPHDALMQASNGFLNSRRSSKQVLPTTGYGNSRIPSPTRHLSESHRSARQGFVIPSKEIAKERPGFFRRVFGSSRGAGSVEPLITCDPNQQSREGSRASCRHGQPPTNRLYKPHATEDLSKAQPENVPPPLVKKPSSFFRRRKKSVSENVPTPVLPPHFQANIGKSPLDQAAYSPTSSLRRVMNPYLDSPKISPRTTQTAQVLSNNQITSVGLHADGTRPRPSTEPAPQGLSSSGLKTRAKGRHHLDMSSAPIETLDAKGPFNHTIASIKLTETPFLGDGSGESHKPDLKEHVYSSNEAWSRAPRSSPADLTPRSKSKSAAGNSGQRHKENLGNLGVLSPRNTDSPSSGRDTVGKAKKLEVRTRLRDTQAKAIRRQPSTQGAVKSSSNHKRVHETETETPLPVEGTEIPPGSKVSHSATSALPPLNTNVVCSPEPAVEGETNKLSLEANLSLPTSEDHRLAKLLFDGDDTVTPRSMAAAWLGEPGPERARIRKAYMELFRWQNLNILAALRDLCGQLYLKGESQQVDRILDAFSARWCFCNPSHGFKASDVVHTICYSILLLNTDLHQAEIETKMTRTQFLKNIMPTIRRVVTDAVPDAFTNPRASTMPPTRSWEQQPETMAKSSTFHESGEGKRSYEGQRPVYMLSQSPSDQTVYSSNSPPSVLDYNVGGECGPLVKTPFHGKFSTWETQIEIVLKDFYNLIRQQPLPLFGAEGKQSMLEAPTSASNNFLRRTPSLLSKAGSESQIYSRGRPSDNRLGTGRWQSKTRSRPRLYPASTVTSSRRSSFDEHSSVTSPSVASAWSKFSSLGKTQTTLSTESFASSYPQGEYQQSIGFANALSQAIIREEGAGMAGDEESLRAAPLLEDESLELHGAPWAKEGILKHKHHLESVDKKAKDRNWIESFCVIEKGYMRLFSFSMNAKSLRQRAKSQKAIGGVVGGGNWADNAELLGSFVLRQSLASGLPEPGYSKARPHVWALSLPTGAIHLFQAGTPEIVKEFVATANYWSARLSKEPLVGGVSNIEYGWSSSVINTALIHPVENTPASTSVSGTRPSLQSSIRSGRSSMDQGSYRPKLPGDKIMINDWTPPPQSMVASALMEVDQLKALSNYVKNIDEELQKHNELRGAVLLAVSQGVSGWNCGINAHTLQFSPRHPNSSRAMTNWERKSSYLLHELVKFKTYIDSLRDAQTRKATIYAARDGQDVAASSAAGALKSKAGQEAVEG
ncbi:MAG: hypothetical protein Q9163_001679 [Psora crenata]